MSALEENNAAFMNPKNTHTVRAVYYDEKSGNAQALALKTATYLSERGFPAMVPVRKGGYVFVCVGAAPAWNDEDLMRIQRELRLIPGPPPSSRSGDFESAYIDKIEKLIQR